MATTDLQPMYGYLRVSKVGARGDDLISPELQQHSIESWAARNGYFIVDWIPDVDKSGRDFGKRRVAEMIDGIRAGKAKGVALWKWSRWGRNLLQSRIYIAQVEDAGGEVRAAEEDFDPTTTMGKFTRDQMLSIAELQSNQISDSWKDTQAKRRRDGLPHNGAPRWGYSYGRKTGYVIDPVIAPGVELAYREYVDGKPMLSIARELNELGIYNAMDRPWSGQTLGPTLDQGFAAGYIRERSAEKAKKAKKSWAIHAFDIWRKGIHQPIISEELWEAYKALRLASAGQGRRRVERKYTLTGSLTCAECGGNLTSRYGGADNRQMWVCGRRDRKKSMGLEVHRPVSVDQYRVAEELQSWLNGHAAEAGTVKISAANARSRPVSNVAALQAHLDLLAGESATLTRQLMRSKITEEIFDTLAAEVQKEVDEVSRALAMAKAKPKEKVRPSRTDFETWALVWNAATTDEQRRILDVAVSGIAVRAGRYSSSKIRVVPSWG